jgi:hypothetical protein
VAAPADANAQSAVPRLEFGQLPPALAEVLAPRVERLGYLGEFFQRMAHQPEVLLAFHDFTERGRRALGETLTELVALTVSTELDNAYERHQHERRSVGGDRSRAWVAAVERRRPEETASVLDGQERLAQAVVLAALRRDDAAPALVDRYASLHGAPSAVALLFVAARYVAHSLVVHSFGITAPVPTIFEDGVDG